MFGKILGGVAAVLLVAALVVGYSFFRTPEEASQPIEAATPEDTVSAPGETTYTLVQAESEARFLIDEVLRGSDFTVVGATNQVAADLSFNLDDPQGAEVGTIRVNARTLATDSEFRDRAIKNRILYTDDYEFVTFTPTELTGLPDAAVPGEAFDFQMTGDLTITDVTRPVTFDVTVTPTAAGTLTGSASTTFPYADFSLDIPASQSVQAVADELRLELTFTAVEGA